MSNYKVGGYLFAGMIAAHAILFAFANAVTAVAIPVLVAIVIGYVLTLRSEQSLRIMSQKSSHPYRGLLLFAALTIAAFYFWDDQISVRLQILRALVADVTALQLGSIAALRVHKKNKRRLATAD